MVYKPRIALWDIETAPSLGYFWGKIWETDIIKVEIPWYMLCFSYKWLGEHKIHTHSLREYPHYKRDFEDDQRLIKDLWKLFDEADILIAHNGDRFDIRSANARFLKYGMQPPTPYKTIDTLKLARKYFLFESNRLNALGEYLKVGKKIPTTGFDLWKRCMTGDEKAWEKMEQYNRKDVVLLERVYEKLRPYHANHINLNLYTQGDGCPVCQHTNIRRIGIYYGAARLYQRWRCNDCGHSFRGEYIPRQSANK